MMVTSDRYADLILIAAGVLEDLQPGIRPEVSGYYGGRIVRALLYRLEIPIEGVTDSVSAE